MKVLLVENHISLRNIVKRKLNSMNRFELIDETNSGETAWQLILSNDYSLVICDATLSDISGLDLIKRCRRSEELRFLPFVMMGSETDGSIIASALGEWGASDYIVKPFSLGDLELRITRVLERIDCPEERLYKQIQLLKKKGKANDALSLLNRDELLSTLNMARWVNLRGECLALAGESEAAIDEFQRAIEISKILIAAYKNCADVNIEIGRVEDAVAILKTAEEISPIDDERSLKLGELLLVTGKIDEGRNHLMRVRNRYRSISNKLDIDRKIANLFMENNLQSDAENVYINIVEDESDIDDYNMLGIIFRQQGKYKEAEDCYFRALKQYPNHPTIYYNLAVLSLVKDNRFAARKYVMKALKHDPNHERALHLLRRIEKGSS